MSVLLYLTVLTALCADALQVKRFLSMKALTSGKVLIIQNKGGGHGEIGYQLCKTLKETSPNVDIVMLQDE